MKASAATAAYGFLLGNLEQVPPHWDRNTHRGTLNNKIQVVYGLLLYTGEELDRLFAQTAIYQSVCLFALNTQVSYSTGVRSFVSFCIFGRARGFLAMMLPATDDVLAWWVMFMVTDRKVKPSNAKKYTLGVRALHLQLGLVWTPVRERWAVHAALQGCGRRRDTPSKQTMPCGFEELLRMAVVVNPNSFLEIVVFAAMLTTFFFFFRKDNVSVAKADAWNPRGHLVRSDVSFPVVEEGTRQVDIRVQHSKTIQAGERYHTVRAVEVPDSPICVVMALWRVWQMPNLGPDGPLFCTEDAKGRLKPLIHSVFVAGFRKLMARAGLDPAAYTCHSFRRGGATAAFKLQLQDALIQARGDWASECYKLYCDMDSAPQLILPSAIAAAATRAFEMRA
ncbi:hypothetical protein CYMTET_55362 [Cymbomonas tetramitiformis]|uniref:Tyr recombinase domain-containing protein n=1 Tax=Cymbomonas tetramitiformis TaxID=36881 RepID=A0AAE0BEA7_9CHLO|nr:hypothetical protein CYMTET_55362 [Cymbomonas tetramitiformis]